MPSTKKPSTSLASQRGQAFRNDKRMTKAFNKGQLPGSKKLDKIRQDGFANIYTGQGVQGKDKQLGSFYASDYVFQELELARLYRGNGFARRVIDLPTGEMVREWFDVQGDTEGDLQRYMHRLCAKEETLRSLRWADLYGGSVMLMGIDDGGALEDPVNEENIRSIAFLKTFDRHRTRWNLADLNNDPNSNLFGEPEWYTIYPINRVGVSQFRVHVSRLLIFDGVDISDRQRQEQQGWGDSVMQSIYLQLQDLVGAYHSAKSIIDDFEQIIINIDNLQDLIAAGRDAEVKKRLEIIDLGRHIMNTILLDGEEKYSKESSSIAGLDRLLEKFMMALSAVTGIPMTLLMGQSPAGMNSTGESDIRQWFDHVSSMQEDKMLKQMERLSKVILNSADGPTMDKDFDIDNIVIEFNPLWQPSEKETVETRKIVAESDQIYIDAGVLLPEEVAESRFGGDTYSIDTALMEEDREGITNNSLAGGINPMDDDAVASAMAKQNAAKATPDGPSSSPHSNVAN